MAGNLLLSLVHAGVVQRGKSFEVERVQARELAVVIQLLGNAEEGRDDGLGSKCVPLPRAISSSTSCGVQGFL